MSELCNCATNAGRTALTACAKGQSPIRKDFFWCMIGSDGTPNVITSDDLDENGYLKESFLISKLNAVDIRDRIIPIPFEYENSAPTRTDSTVETTDRGTQFFIQSGVVQMVAQLKNIPHSWSWQINQLRCLEIGVLHIDEENRVLGEVNAAGTELAPRRIEKNNLEGKPYYGTDTTVSYTEISYQLSRLADESKFIGLAGAEVDLLEVEGLIPFSLLDGQVTSTYENSTTEIYVDAKIVNYGTLNNQALSGLVAGNFTVTNTATGLDLTIDSVAEPVTGKYLITLNAAAASANLDIKYVETRTEVNDKGYGANTYNVTLPAS